MKSHLPERLYLGSPVWLQNILVSIYGALEHKRRYGGPHQEYLEHLRENVMLNRQEIANLQSRLLHGILSDAAKYVPAYQTLGLGPSPSLEDFPLLERESIAINPDSFVSSRYDKNKLLTLFTGAAPQTH